MRAFLYDTYTANREGGVSTGSAVPPRLPLPAHGLGLEPGRRPRLALLRGAARRAGDGVFVTDVAGLHSGVNPVTGVFSVGASGRAIRGGELAEPLREFTIASDLVSMLGAVSAAGAEARWVPFGGSVRTPPLLIGAMSVAAPEVRGALTPSPLLDWRPSSTPEEDFRRDQG